MSGFSVQQLKSLRKEGDLDAAFRLARYTEFVKSRALFCFLVSLAAPSVAVYIAGIVDNRNLFIWVLVCSVLSAVFLYTCYGKYPNSNITKHGIPKGMFSAGMTTSFVIGCVFWVDISAASIELAQIASITVLAAIATRAVLFGALTQFVRWTICSISLPGTVALAVYSEFDTIPVALISFAVLFGFYFPLRQRNRLLEVVRLREEAWNKARSSALKAKHDHLTGLLNRLGVLSALKSEPSSRVESLLFVDLDRFKDVNDRLGHGIGDQVLISVARRIDETVGNSGLVARLGGDEFLIVVTSDIDEEYLSDLIIQNLEEPFKVVDDEVHISASIGISLSKNRGEQITQMLQHSDYALYQAKQTGRGRAVVFTDEIAEQRTQHARDQENLRRAVRSNSLEFWGQPIYEVNTGEVESVELLARWFSNGAYIPPDKFIPIAEDIGLIDQITLKAFDTFTDCVERWKNIPGLKNAKVSINVSPISFERGSLLQSLKGRTDETDADLSKLIVEITEGVMLKDAKRISAELAQICDLGVSIAIDDFGTGYSSMSQIFDLPISKVKIDKSLVDQIFEDTNRQEMIKTVVNMVESLGKFSVAEGVETVEQLEVLKDLRIKYVQGFLLCKPMPLDELELRYKGYFDRNQKVNERIIDQSTVEVKR